jgi:2-methylisocitrate lyase-like PEP mutase family enzyme
MQHISSERISWKEALDRESPLLLPVAHDALSARIIARTGFTALQIGGFAVEGSRHGVPDIDLTHYAERHAAVKDIIGATSLPIMVDCDDGYGDAKNVTYTVRGYEALGVQALFIEDQRAPKKCGHMNDKKVVSAETMGGKIEAAVAARQDDRLFILARTDALQPEGLDSALRRGERYLEAGADGIYVEGAESHEHLRAIGREFKGTQLATSVLENGGKTPWLPPKELGGMGFTMILYPTTILFRVTRAIERAAADLLAGRPLDRHEAVNMEAFEKIVDLEHWQRIEKSYDA